MSERRSIVLVYHFFYPDDVISARLFAQLARWLSDIGWDVTVLTSNRYRHQPQQKISPTQEMWGKIRIVRVARPAWNQDHKIARLANCAWMLMAWTWRLLRLPRQDVLIIGSDPPFSAILFPLLRKLKVARFLIHWCYDLYPEAIVADGAGKIIDRLCRVLASVMGWAYSHADVLVDIGPCMQERLQAYRHDIHCVTITPWSMLEPKSISIPEPQVRREIFGDAGLALLYSGNLGKAHDFALFVALARLLGKWRCQASLVFSCRGSRCEALTRTLTPEDANIRLTPFVDDDDLPEHLAAADIHLVSLRPQWQGIVIPSKFFTSLAMGKPVLYVGPEESAIAGWIRSYHIGWVLSTAQDLEKVARQLAEASENSELLEQRGRNAYQAYHLYFSRQAMLQRWRELLQNTLTY